uniref:Uncharacterized protein n=1 Tax=Streptomyces sp. F2 TaxID=317660 RepID=V9Z171_9ACTN|nr:hypothetical protein pFRL4_77c [Streptomyces sp. F2]
MGPRVPLAPGPDLLQRGAQPGTPVGPRRARRCAQRRDAPLEPVGTTVSGDELGDRPCRSARVPRIPQPKYVEPGREFLVFVGGRASSTYVDRGIPALIQVVFRPRRF